MTLITPKDEFTLVPLIPYIGQFFHVVDLEARKTEIFYRLAADQVATRSFKTVL